MARRHKTDFGYVETEYVRVDRQGYDARGSYHGAPYYTWFAYTITGELLTGCAFEGRISDDVGRALGNWRRTVWAQWEYGSDVPDAYRPLGCVGFVLPEEPAAGPLDLRLLPRDLRARIRFESERPLPRAPVAWGVPS